MPSVCGIEVAVDDAIKFFRRVFVNMECVSFIGDQCDQ